MSLTDLRAAFDDDCESWAPIFCECRHPARTPLGMCLGCHRRIADAALRARVAAHKAQRGEA